MSNKRSKTILEVAIIAMILLAGLLTITGCDPSESAAVRERIAINANADSYVRNGYDFYFYSDDRTTQKLHLEGAAGNVDAEGTLNVAGVVTLQNDLRVGNYVIYSEQSVVVCTEGAPITATGTYQPITSTAAITSSTTCAIYSGTVVGQVVWLVNENASDEIIVDDGANTDLGGNVTLGSGDILKLLWDGANWLGLGTANN